MAIAARQSLSELYKAVFQIPAVGVSAPKRDATNNVTTCEATLNISTDTAGNLLGSYVGQRINTATTATVKTGAGILGGIAVNTPAAGTITVYDNTTATGTIIAVITLTATGPVGTLLQNIQFNTGLTIVTSAVMDITVLYN